MPESLFPQLQAERAKYGAGMTNNECVALLNAVAYRNPGWGLLLKPSGNNGTTDGLGRFVSIDHLVYQPLMRGIDVLSDAGNGGPSSVGWGDVESGEEFPVDRFVAPVKPAGQPEPVPTPEPGPTPPPPSVDLSPVLEAIAKVQADLMAARGEVATVALKVDAVMSKPAPDYAGEVRVKVLGTAPITLRPQG